MRDGRIVAGRYVRLACQRHLRDLGRQRAHSFPYYFDPGEVAELLEFFKDYLTLDDVDEHDQPITFTLVRWMQFCLGSLVGWKRASNGHLRFVEAYFETGKGSTKCLALDTPIPTPSGWTTIESIQLGNQVFDEQGRIVDVVAVSTVKTGLPCYRLTFDDGSSIVADEDHLWMTEQRRFSGRGDRLATAGISRDHRGGWRRKVRSTREIFETQRYPNGKYQSANHSIQLSAPLDLPTANLPIDPYVLGVWLGDGDSDGARLTIGEQDADAMRSQLVGAGVAMGARQGPPEKTGRYRVSVDNGESLTTILRRIGVLQNKHVPAAYLRASISQRLDLLQGLMDTDGMIVPGSGECRFSSSRRHLAQDVAELVVSMGMKCTLRERRAMLRGRDVGPTWIVQFHPPHDLPVFRLSRKAQWQRQRHQRRRLSGDRRVVHVDAVTSVPVKCIGVTGPSHLFLAGLAMVPTHNTPAAAAYGIYRLVGTNRTNVENYSLGVNADQANYLYGFAKRMCDRSEDLRDLLNVGEYNTAWIARNSFFRPLTSEGRSLDNKRVFTALIDELHEVPAIIPEKMRLGIKTQVDGQVVMITNAGYDKTSVCWTKHDYGVKVLEGTVADEEYFPYICQLDPCEACRVNGLTQPDDSCKACDDWTDERVWPKVNPAIIDLPQLVTYLRGVVRQALNQPSTLARTKRLNFCCWTQGHSIWIPSDQWDACRSEIVRPPSGVPCAAAFDMSMKLDLTGCAVAQRFDDPPAAKEETVEIDENENGQTVKRIWKIKYRIRLKTFAWLPEETLVERVKNEQIPYDVWRRAGHLRVTPGPVIDENEIYDQFVGEIGPTYRPQRVGYDPYNATGFAVDLRDRAKYTVVEIGQGRKLSEYIKLFYALVRLRRIEHDGNPVFAWCVANAEPKHDRYENIWLEKPSGGKRIDLAIAAVMALSQVLVLPVPRHRRRGAAKTWTPDGWRDDDAQAHA